MSYLERESKDSYLIRYSCQSKYSLTNKAKEKLIKTDHQEVK